MASKLRSTRPGGRAVRARALPALVLAFLVLGSGMASAEAVDRAVRSSPHDERTPVAGAGYLAWAQNAPDHPRRYGLFVKHFGEAPHRVNAEGTSAFAGGIDGTTLVYSLAAGGHSSIRFLDLGSGATFAAPPGVNSPDAWQSGPSLSGRYLLFTRQFSQPTVWKIVLYDMETARLRTLDRVGGPYARYAQSGQVAGDYATWQVCTPYCKVFEYRISTRQTFFVPNPERRFHYAPAVTDDGTVYFAESHAACGNVTIERYTPGGTPVTVHALAANTDLSFMSARERNGHVELLYDATSCTDYAGDLRAITL